MKRSSFFFALIVIIIGVVIGYLALIAEPPGDTGYQIGYSASPMLSVLYTAKDSDSFLKKGLSVSFVELGSTNEVGYSLLSGKIDAGFVDPQETVRLLDSDKDRKIRIAGAVNFPYGASLVIRKDHNVRLDDIEGLTIAAEEEDCALFKQFRKDAEKYGVNTSNISYVFIEFEDMLPALEAGIIDGAVTGVNQALIAESKGHKTLYQNWEVKEKDDCCAIYLQNIEYFFLVKGMSRDAVNDITQVFVSQNAIPTEDRIISISKNSGFPEGPLSKYPASDFVDTDNLDHSTRAELEQYIWK